MKSQKSTPSRNAGFKLHFLFAAFTTILLANTACRAQPTMADNKAASPSAAARKPASFDVTAFERAREIIRYRNDLGSLEKNDPRNGGALSKTKQKKQKRDIVNLPESSVIEYLQAHPESLRQDVARLAEELSAHSAPIDTTKSVRLVPPAGTNGYDDLKIFVSHPYRIEGKPKPADDLVEVLKSEIRRAKKEIVLNVYEFDLEDVANELVIAARDRKVAVRVGVDAKPLKGKPRQLAIVERLRGVKIDVTEVNSVGINHQKMIAIDWTDPEFARAVFSSGNFTHSCLDPLGDLNQVKPHPAQSIPNANHLITMKSWLAANLINHELTKTFSKELGLRGRSYPMTGAYQITGPGVDPQTLEAYPKNSFVISFTPGGGYRSSDGGGVNRNILGYLLEKIEGPIRMVQFAYSSADISRALLARAERAIQMSTIDDLKADSKAPGTVIPDDDAPALNVAKKEIAIAERAMARFDFKSVGETPFAMQGWSQFLKMSGLKKNTKTSYVDDPENPWTQALGDDRLHVLRKNVRVAPARYGNTRLKVGDTVYDVSAKIHHKIMSVGDFAVIGTSFNFSEGAEKNNEQVLVFNDPSMAAVVRGITDELFEQSPRSVYEEAERRNARAVRFEKTKRGGKPAPNLPGRGESDEDREVSADQVIDD